MSLGDTSGMIHKSLTLKSASFSVSIPSDLRFTNSVCSCYLFVE